MHAIGIVHLGLGAFHRAHQAWYTDKAISAAGGDWRIAAVSMRSRETAQALAEQDGLFLLNECDAGGTRTTLVASIGKALALHGQRQEIVDLLASPDCRIVTLTVTEKAYLYDPRSEQIDLRHPDVVSDLADLSAARTVPGLLVHALARRMETGAGGVSILSCDNLPDNGVVTRRVVHSLAGQVAPELRDWIAGNVVFPSSMVDRITPAVSGAFLRRLAEQTGVDDRAAIQTETFSQWVIEDDFPYGRPAWQAAGALLVREIGPYEDMKLRLLNGSHSLLAYTGHLAGKPTIRSCMQDPVLRRLLGAHMQSVATTLAPLEGVDYDRYASALMARFDNPGIEHLTYQIAMDGSQKMRQRIFAPTLDLLNAQAGCETCAFAAAAWFRYCQGQTETGEAYALRDPREAEITAALSGCTDAGDIVAAAIGIDGLVPAALAGNTLWRSRVTRMLQDIVRHGGIGRRQKTDGAENITWIRHWSRRVNACAQHALYDVLRGDRATTKGTFIGQPNGSRQEIY